MEQHEARNELFALANKRTETLGMRNRAADVIDAAALDETTGQQLFIMAGANNLPNICRLLIEKKAVNADDALDWAVRNGKKDICVVALEQGADINRQDNDDAVPADHTIVNPAKQQTPLHKAVIHNHPDVIRLLVEKGAELDRRDIFGCTPLDYALAKKFEKAARILLEHGATPNIVSNLMRDAEGNNFMQQILTQMRAEGWTPGSKLPPAQEKPPETLPAPAAEVNETQLNQLKAALKKRSRFERPDRDDLGRTK